MLTYHFISMILLSVLHCATSYYLQDHRYNEPPLIFYNEIYPDAMETNYPIPEEEDHLIEVLRETRSPINVDKRVTANQINSLLKNTWIG